MTKEEIQEVSELDNPVELFEAINQNPEMIKQRVYSIKLSNELEMHFWMTKRSCLPSFPIFCPFDICTDLEKFIFDLINTKDDYIDYEDRITSMHVLLNKPIDEILEEYGYFGDDFCVYQGLKAHKKIVPIMKGFNEVTQDMIDSIKEIEEIDYN